MNIPEPSLADEKKGIDLDNAARDTALGLKVEETAALIQREEENSQAQEIETLGYVDNRVESRESVKQEHGGAVIPRVAKEDDGEACAGSVMQSECEGKGEVKTEEKLQRCQKKTGCSRDQLLLHYTISTVFNVTLCKKRSGLVPSTHDASSPISLLLIIENLEKIGLVLL